MVIVYCRLHPIVGGGCGNSIFVLFYKRRQEFLRAGGLLYFNVFSVCVAGGLLQYDFHCFLLEAWRFSPAVALGVGKKLQR